MSCRFANILMMRTIRNAVASDHPLTFAQAGRNVDTHVELG
jgi:hypothetical protein